MEYGGEDLIRAQRIFLSFLICASLLSSFASVFARSKNAPPIVKNTVKNNTRVSFTLKRILLEGNHLFSTEDLQSQFEDKIGKQVNFQDISEIAERITYQYRCKGYLLSRAIVPTQAIEAGVVRITIFEGYISSFRSEIFRSETCFSKLFNSEISNSEIYSSKISNSTLCNAEISNSEIYYSKNFCLLSQYGKKIMENQPLKVQVLERYTLLANDIPGMTVRSILTPSKADVAGSELVFQADEEKFEGSLGIDNRGTRYLGRNQFFLSGNVNSLFRPGDTTGIQTLFTGKKKGLYLFRVEHQELLGSEGTQLTVSETISNSSPGYLLLPINVIGKARMLSTILLHPLLRSQVQNLYVSGIFDLISNRTNAMKNMLLFRDKISSLRFSVLYDNEDAWFGSNFSELTASKGLPILGASKPCSENLSRPNGRSDYSKMSGKLGRIQRFNPWISLLVSFRGQYAFNPLLAAEQITYGGLPYGRAYDPSEITGDKGIDGLAELRYTTALTSLDAYQCMPKFIEYYVFYDFGAVWNPLPNMPAPRESGTSTGIGFRINFEALFCNAEVTKPLTRIVAANQNKNLRVFFGLYAYF